MIEANISNVKRCLPSCLIRDDYSIRKKAKSLSKCNRKDISKVSDDLKLTENWWEGLGTNKVGQSAFQTH